MHPNLDTTTVLMFLSLITRIFYPFIRRKSISTLPLRCMVPELILEAAEMAYATGTQYMIYNVLHCFSTPPVFLASPNSSISKATYI